MKLHPVHGANILRHIHSPMLERILPGVLAHHERWDGSGYPRQLAGADIPFLGRLLAVADVLDALSSGRPYRESVSFADAIELLRRRAGIDFDPAIVEAAVRLHERGELEVPTRELWRRTTSPDQRRRSPRSARRAAHALSRGARRRTGGSGRLPSGATACASRCVALRRRAPPPRGWPPARACTARSSKTICSSSLFVSSAICFPARSRFPAGATYRRCSRRPSPARGGGGEDSPGEG